MRHILILFICSFATCMADDAPQNSQDIALDIRINCPMSDEYEEFLNAIPTPGSHTVDYEEWKASFIDSMTKLINLLESDQVNTSFWSVTAEEHKEIPAASFGDAFP